MTSWQQVKQNEKKLPSGEQWYLKDNTWAVWSVTGWVEVVVGKKSASFQITTISKLEIVNNRRPTLYIFISNNEQPTSFEAPLNVLVKVKNEITRQTWLVFS